MSDRISRKSFIKASTAFVAGFAAGQIPAGGNPRSGTPVQPLPWPYKPLDPEAVRRNAHDAFYEHGCGFAGFAALIRELRESVGVPFTSLPIEIMSYAGGGIKGWGTVCGALNGACAVISLVCDGSTSGKIIDAMMIWYTRSPLPEDISNGYGARRLYKVDKGISVLPQTVSGSPLCHISATKWCAKAGRSIDSAERLERCARLSGDVAAFVVKALNDSAAALPHPAVALTEAARECLGCHGSTGEQQNVAARFDCTPCHKPHQ